MPESRHTVSRPMKELRNDVIPGKREGQFMGKLSVHAVFICRTWRTATRPLAWWSKSCRRIWKLRLGACLISSQRISHTAVSRSDTCLCRSRSCSISFLVTRVWQEDNAPSHSCKRTDGSMTHDVQVMCHSSAGRSQLTSRTWTRSTTKRKTTRGRLSRWVRFSWKASVHAKVEAMRSDGSLDLCNRSSGGHVKC